MGVELKLTRLQVLHVTRPRIPIEFCLVPLSLPVTVSCNDFKYNNVMGL